MRDRYADHLRAQLALVEATGRWTATKKSILCELLNRKALTVAEACERYDLSADEVRSWLDRAAQHGRTGLHATKLQFIEPERRRARA